MTITYRPKGVCSRLMRVEVENGIIRKVEVHGGRALRQQADLLPGSACQGAASGAVRREKD